MDEQIVLVKSISFAEFKKATHHKGVDYTWIPMLGKHKTANGCTRAFSSKEFYCNKDYKSKMFSMPSFMLDIETQFYRVDADNLRAKSELGAMQFRIISRDEEITRDENDAFEKEVAEEN